MADNQAKNILIFSMTYLPYVGGAEIAVKEITDRVPGFDFDLITAKLDKTLPEFERIGKINLYRVGWGNILDKYFYPFLAYSRAKKLHQEKDYQIVQAIMAFYGGIAALFFKWKYPRVKYLLTMQSGDSDFFIWIRTWFWYPIYKKIYTQPDYIQVISRFLEKRARKYGYKGKIEIIPNGVDLDIFKPKAIQKESNQKVILSVSRLAKKNGIGDLIKAGKYLDFPFKMIIIGKGPEEEKLKNLSKRLGLTDKIVFQGHIQHQVLPKYYSMADVFVRPSLTEGFGNVFIEAMATGVPVVGTPVGGIPDFLIDQENGLFCKLNNPQDIALKIKEILKDENLNRKLVQNGLKTAQEYSWNKIGQKMEAIYQKLI